MSLAFNRNHLFFFFRHSSGIVSDLTVSSNRFFFLLLLIIAAHLFRVAIQRKTTNKHKTHIILCNHSLINDT